MNQDTEYNTTTGKFGTSTNPTCFVTRAQYLDPRKLINVGGVSQMIVLPQKNPSYCLSRVINEKYGKGFGVEWRIT